MTAQIKEARAKIEAILKEMDIGGFVSLHTPGMGEVFWNLWPSYSILKGDFPRIRIVSKASDYSGRHPSQQMSDMANTAQMVKHIAHSLGGCAPQFQQISQAVDKAVGAKHSEPEITPSAPPLPKTDDRTALEAAHVLISRMLHSYENMDMTTAVYKTGELIRAQAAGASEEVFNKILQSSDHGVN